MTVSAEDTNRCTRPPMRAYVAAVLLIVASAGCGHPGPQATPDGALAPSVAAMFPEDGARRVHVVTAPIGVRFTAAVDASSINATSVRLSKAGDLGAPKRRVAGAIAYDEIVHQVVFTPAVPLSYGATYTLDVAGVTANGLPVAAATATFRTYGNPMVSSTHFMLDGTTPLERFELRHDNDGVIIEDAWITKGPDDQFGTLDDGISHLYTSGPVPGGWRTAEYDGPGPDQKWRTADDAVVRYDDVRPLDGGSRRVTYTAAGSDGSWFTADDVGLLVVTTRYDDAGRLVERRLAAPGPDGKLGTADDFVGSVRAIYKFPDDPTRDDHDEVTYADPGPDKTWMTDDDVIYSVNRWQYDERGLLTIYSSVSAGADHTFGTSDDVTDHISHYEYDTDGKLSRETVQEARTDGKLGTNDDLYDDRDFDYAGSDNVHVVKTQSAGLDMKFNTPDDYLAGIEQYDFSH
jgi:Bacterial Ig-like domain